MRENLMIKFSNAHGDKLRALLLNSKLPHGDRLKVEEAVARYQEWLQNITSVEGTFDEQVMKLVDLLNEYRLYLDLDLVFGSSSDFLYRQKGQLKLDNSVVEEFLPIFLTRVLKDVFENRDLSFGPTTCFSSVYFSSSIVSDEYGGGLNIREKAQDFVISRKLFIQASHNADFTQSVTRHTNIAYVAAECKTNLDKTMFQEAAATALDLKTSVPAAKYFLLCEWLDMTPISSSVTAIDEIIILRKAKRLSSDVRRNFNTAEGRAAYRDFYEQYLRAHPFVPDTFSRFASHIRALMENRVEDNVLERGYF